MGTLDTGGWGAEPELGDNISAKAVIWSHRHTEAASLEVTRLQPESVQAPRPVSQATQRTEAGSVTEARCRRLTVTVWGNGIW